VNLPKFTYYNVSVAAFNGVGVGPQSAVDAVTQEGGMLTYNLCKYKNMTNYKLEEPKWHNS
jgi:hypothetical protein